MLILYVGTRHSESRPQTVFIDEEVCLAVSFSLSLSTKTTPQYFLEVITRALSWFQGPFTRAKDKMDGSYLLGLPQRIPS